jgi:transcriptional regulator with GAF, ATPase, and Fis domain
VAVRGDPLLVSEALSLVPVFVEKGSFLGRLATSRLTTHIPDFTAPEGDHRDDHWVAATTAGFRTGLIVPLLKDNEIVGIITLGRKQVQPFTDKQISLCKDFAVQASIALESTRRERQYREAQIALAHANRVTWSAYRAVPEGGCCSGMLGARANPLRARLLFAVRN